METLCEMYIFRLLICNVNMAFHLLNSDMDEYNIGGSYSFPEETSLNMLFEN